MKPEIALAWVLSAENTLQNNGWFTSKHLVFGHNVGKPSIVTDRLPA